MNKPMSQKDYETLLKIRSKEQLTYTKTDMGRSAYGRPWNQDSEKSILDDVKKIDEIMTRYDKSFVEFTSFTDDDRIRYQHKWDISFIGVGYTKLSLLLNGFPLGNYSKTDIKNFEDSLNDK